MNPEQGEEARPTRVGPYLLERRLGSGGMGAVWRAWDERLKRPVAVKQIRPDRLDQPGARTRLRQEAAAGARLNHPAIVHIYDLLEIGEVDWIVMELVEGQTLEKILSGGPLDLPRAIRLGREIAKGLAKAHSQGIVHRDLKTSNVMITPSGHAKILDFGIAKLVSSESGDSTASHGGIVGTPHAMSPEQVLGQTVDLRSDLFSFGSLLYEMITGISPFRAKSAVATLGLVCNLRQPPVRQLQPEVPPELSELIEWLLEKEAQHRPKDATEVAAVLNALLARLALEESAASRPDLPRHAPEDPAEQETIVEWSPGLPGLQLATGERRQVTVVCCGLVEIAASGAWRSPDPESLSEVLPELRRVAEEVGNASEGPPARRSDTCSGSILEFPRRRGMMPSGRSARPASWSAACGISAGGDRRARAWLCGRGSTAARRSCRSSGARRTVPGRSRWCSDRRLRWRPPSRGRARPGRCW